MLCCAILLLSLLLLLDERRDIIDFVSYRLGRNSALLNEEVS